MTTMKSQITSLTVVYSIVYSDADQRKHQSSASLAFVRGIHRDRWIPRTKSQLREKCFHLMTSSCRVHGNRRTKISVLVVEISASYGASVYLAKQSQHGDLHWINGHLVQQPQDIDKVHICQDMFTRQMGPFYRHAKILIITYVCPMKCGETLTHFQTSTVSPLKFGDKYVISQFNFGLDNGCHYLPCCD